MFLTNRAFRIDVAQRELRIAQAEARAGHRERLPIAEAQLTAAEALVEDGSPQAECPTYRSDNPWGD